MTESQTRIIDVYTTQYLNKKLFEDVGDGQVKCLVCVEIQNSPTNYAKRADNQKLHIDKHQTKNPQVLFKVLNREDPSEPNNKKQKVNDDRQPTILFNQFQQLYPQYSSLTEVPEFSSFLSAVGVSPVSLGDIKESVFSELQKLAGEGEHFVIQLAEPELLGRKFLKVDLVFINKMFENVRLTIGVLAKDSSDDSELIVKSFKKITEQFKLSADNVVRVESKATGDYPKIIAKQFNLSPVRPVANQIASLFSPHRVLSGELKDFQARFNSIVTKVSNSTKLQKMLVEAAQTEPASIPPLIKDNSHLAEFLSALDWADKFSSKVNQAFLKFNMPSGDVFANSEEHDNLNYMKSDLEQPNELLERIEMPEHKSKLIDYIKKLVANVNLIDLSKYKGTTGAEIKEFWRRVKGHLTKLNKNCTKELSWLSFLDIRYEYLGSDEFDLQQEFNKLVEDIAADKATQPLGENEDVSVRRAKKPKNSLDEFDEFKKDQTYNPNLKLSDIFASVHFSSGRYPTIAKLFKSYYCRETFIQNINFKALDRKADLVTQLFVHQNRDVIGAVHAHLDMLQPAL